MGSGSLLGSFPDDPFLHDSFLDAERHRKRRPALKP
jgi:hypothetical protein